jgi:hypothetical protein
MHLAYSKNTDALVILDHVFAPRHLEQQERLHQYTALDASQHQYICGTLPVALLGEEKSTSVTIYQISWIFL